MKAIRMVLNHLAGNERVGRERGRVKVTRAGIRQMSANSQRPAIAKSRPAFEKTQSLEILMVSSWLLEVGGVNAR